MKRILITGWNGFIGRHLVNELLTLEPRAIILIANTSNFYPEYQKKSSLYKDSPLTFRTADIKDKRAISEIFLNERPDTCIHLAAKISVSDSIKNPNETMEVNVKGTMNVLDACYRSKVNNFIFASSAAVYGDVNKLPISENVHLKPLSPYGTSKMLAEQQVINYHNLKKIPNVISFRIFNVYGDGNISESDVVSKFASRLSKKLPPVIHGDGNYTRDFISVDDVVDGILVCVRAMESQNYGNFDYPPVFNMGSGNGTSISELANKMIAISGLELEAIHEKVNQDSGIIMHSYADMTRAKRDLHFIARKNLETGLREIIK